MFINIIIFFNVKNCDNCTIIIIEKKANKMQKKNNCTNIIIEKNVDKI